MPKCGFNKVLKKTLLKSHFGMGVLRTPFLQNTYGGLLLPLDNVSQILVNQLRYSHRRFSIKRGALKKFQNFTGKNCPEIIFR